MRDLEIVQSDTLADLPAEDVDCVILLQDTFFLYKKSCGVWRGQSGGEFAKIANKDAIGLVHMFYHQEVCIVASTGLRFVGTSPSAEEKFVELPTFVECFDWNSGRDILAVIASDSAVKTFNVSPLAVQLIGERDLCQDEAKPFVSVGWGSKDTQFRKLEKHGDSGTVQAESQVLWHPDKDIFAVCYFSQTTKFKIFDSDCNFLYASEEVPSLSSPLAWRPNGSFVYVSQKVAEDQYGIAVFEKNGVFHSKMPPMDPEISGISWSPDSSVLATWWRSGHLVLWSFSNAHYYRKQCLKFPSLSCLQWENSRQFFVVAGRLLVRYSLRWTVHRSSCGLVGVIDGAKLLVTDFSQQKVPPPYSAITLACDEPVNHVSFVPEEKAVVAVTMSNHLLYYSLPQASPVKKIALKPTFPVARHFLAVGEGSVFRVEEDHISLIKWQGDGDVEVDELVKQAGCFSLAALFGGDSLMLQSSSNGDLWYLDEDELKRHCSGVSARGEEMCTWGASSFLLDAHHRLYHDGDILADNATSLAISGDYLLYTTTSDNLVCAPLAGKRKNSPAYSRSVESGSRIVAAMAGRAEVVLQMPRGNIETIKPRCMLVDRISDLVAAGDFPVAFGLLRINRLNPNLLYDLDPELFMKKLDGLIATSSTDDLVLFLGHLEPGNISADLYKNCMLPREPELYADKLAGVTDRFLELDRRKHLLVVVCALLKRGLWSRALQEVSQARASDPAAAEEALAHLVLMSSVEKVYEQALRNGDLQLAGCVAAKSNMDPKEYGPFLKQLEVLEEGRRMHRIFHHLRDHREALRWLVRSADAKEEEVRWYIVQYNLQGSCRDLVDADCPHQAVVCGTVGDFLKQRGRHRDAGIMLKQSGRLEDAYEEFVACDEWDQVVLIGRQLGKAVGEDLKTIARHLAADKSCVEAAYVYERHLDDVEAAFVTLVNGAAWKEALILADRYDRSDLIATRMSKMVDYTSVLRHRFESNTQQLDRYLKRLAVVRQSRASTSCGSRFEEGGEALPSSLADDVSIVSSSFASSSTRSIASSRATSSAAAGKARRKLERKMTDLREGGRFEDIALVSAVHQVVAETFAAAGDVLCLSLDLAKNGAFSSARNLQQSYKELSSAAETAVQKVWTEELLQGKATAALMENWQHLDPKHKLPPAVQDVKWQIDF